MELQWYYCNVLATLFLVFFVISKEVMGMLVQKRELITPPPQKPKQTRYEAEKEIVYKLLTKRCNKHFLPESVH